MFFSRGIRIAWKGRYVAAISAMKNTLFSLNFHLPKAYAQMEPKNTEPAAPKTVTTRLLSSATASRSIAPL